MNDKFSLLKFLLLFSIFLYSNLLKCPPDHFRPKEYYWPYDDYDDTTTNYGFFFNYRIDTVSQYDDYWSGIIYEPKRFCYNYHKFPEKVKYDNCETTLENEDFTSLELENATYKHSIKVIDNDDIKPNDEEEYIFIDKEKKKFEKFI
jgi:hypothetical protein